jgi:methionyl-tRNA synthetase|tara:strand:- start:31058 stop:32476 length:1419 start_codon:yes stop_codon:yes gene_type:complete
MKEAFYITTTLPYVNDVPHIGFALELVYADIIARHRRLLGDDVFFSTGTDEHGTKIWDRAQEENKDPQAYVDEYASKFDALKKSLNLSYDNFIRTTSPSHKEAAQEFWKRCHERGDIYKKTYKGLYCVGDELFVTERDLVDGKCPNHPNQELVVIEEENYFFRFSKYGDDLLRLYEAHPGFVIPDFRFNEIKTFVERGLEDFSVSRLKKRVPWGIPVPGDEDHVMYVWFDALINYISTLGWPKDEEKFAKFWPVVQFAGKDQIRQQAAMWQAMLLSAGLTPSKQIVIHGFITSGGQKMSKSIGNVIDPSVLIEKYGTDAVRYYLARHVHPFEDSDVTPEKFHESYNAHLANGLGNLVARTMKMAEAHIGKVDLESKDEGRLSEFIDQYEFNKSADYIWEQISKLDQKIQESKPFELVKKDEGKAKEIISELVVSLHSIGVMLKPFMPETAEKIIKATKENKMPDSLFPRLEQ